MQFLLPPGSARKEDDGQFTSRRGHRPPAPGPRRSLDRHRRILPLLFNFAEPASPLVVDGLEGVLAWLQEVEG